MFGAEVQLNRYRELVRIVASILYAKDESWFNDSEAETVQSIAANKVSPDIEEIDEPIQRQQKVQEGLLASDNNLRLANNILDDLTIKKLTKNNPTMQKMVEDAGVDIKRRKNT